METYLLDWANLLLRWAHVITAIAWIGSSFYFVFLDSSLVPPVADDLKEAGVGGELWAVHGGGFYNPQKYLVAPKKLPENLHWFYWESYSTWLTGFALFCVSYLWNANFYLVDKTVFDWSANTAGFAAIGFLVAFWFIYDTLCRVFLKQKNGNAWLGLSMLVLVALSAYLTAHLFSGRAAFLLTGAMLATSMSANVFFWIIPGQKTMVKDMQQGKSVDPIHGIRAKQRSVHNTYFTLPVLFAMLSNHYSFLYNHPQRWILLIAIMTAGALIRQFFVLRHGFKLGKNNHPWPYAAVGVAVLIALIVALKPSAPSSELSATGQVNTNQAGSVTAANIETVSIEQVQKIIEQRCYMCHGAQVQQKGIRLDQASLIEQNASLIYQQVVVTKAMPMSNATQITDAERELIGKWYLARKP